MPTSHPLSRRGFLKRGATVAAGVAAPYIVPSGVLAADGKPGANDRVGLGLIGTGRRSRIRRPQRLGGPPCWS